MVTPHARIYLLVTAQASAQASVGELEVDFAACCRMSRLYDDARIDEESMEDVPKSGRRFSGAILDVT